MKTLLGCLFLSFVGVLSASDVKTQARENLITLQKTGKISKEKLSISPNLAPRLSNIISGTSRVWSSHRLNKHSDYRVLDSYQQNNVAVVFIGSIEEKTLLEVAVHPVCFVKKSEKWKMAPLISNFEFIALDRTSELREDIAKANSWLTEQSDKMYQKQLQFYKDKFLVGYHKEKRRIITEKLDAHGQLTNLFTQVENKSIAGICAAIGLDLSQKKYGKRNVLEVFKIIQAGLKSRKKQVSWNVLKDKKKFVKFVKDENLAKNGGKAVAVAFINPNYKDGYQLTSFTVSLDKENLHIQLPDILFEFENRKYYTGFDERLLDEKMSTLYKEVPKLIFEKTEKIVVKTVTNYHQNLNRVRGERDYRSWLIYNNPKGKIAGETMKQHWQQTLQQWKNKKKELVFKILSSKNSNYRASVAIQVDFRNFVNSTGHITFFKKEKKGWSTTLYSDKSPEEMRKLERQANKLLEEIELDVVANLRKLTTEMKPNQLVQKASDGVKFRKVLEDYFKDLKKVDIAVCLSKTMAFDKKLFNFSWLGGELAESTLGIDRKIIDHKSNGKGIWTFCVEVSSKQSLKSYAFYILAKSKEGIFIDMQHRLVIDADVDWSDFNVNVYKSIEKNYGAETKAFISKSYAEMGKKLEKTEFEF